MKEPIMIKIMKVKDIKNKDVYFYHYNNPNLKFIEMKYICLNNDVEKENFLSSLKKKNSKKNKIIIYTNEDEFKSLDINLKPLNNPNFVDKYITNVLRVGVLESLNFNNVNVKKINELTGKIKQQINNDANISKKTPTINKDLNYLEVEKIKEANVIKNNDDNSIEQSEKHKLMIFSKKIEGETKYFLSFISKEEGKAKKRTFMNFYVKSDQVREKNEDIKLIGKIKNIKNIELVKELILLGENKEIDDILQVIAKNLNINVSKIDSEVDLAGKITTKDFNALNTYIEHENKKDLKLKKELSKGYNYKNVFFKLSGEDDKNIQFTIVVTGKNFQSNNASNKRQSALFMFNKNNISEEKVKAVISKKLKYVASFENMNLINLNEIENNDILKFKEIISKSLNVEKEYKAKELGLSYKYSLEQMEKQVVSHEEDFNKKSMYLSEDKQPEKDSLYIYSDASVYVKKDGDNRNFITYGVILRKPESDRILIEKSGIKVLNKPSSNIAEAHGVLEALIEVYNLIKNDKMPSEIKNIDIKLDNINVVYAINDKDFRSKSFGKKSTEDNEDVLKRIKKISKSISRKYPVRIRWIEGHVKNAFNEMVDSLSAKAYSYVDELNSDKLSFEKTNYFNEDWFNQKVENKIEPNKFKI